MVKIWPENTDPLKFVYEDVGIATYLILLWTQEYQVLGLNKKQSFVDLGCGNGLLVYILASEGYFGFGIDLRKRKIWDMYPESIKLEVQAITPSDNSLFPNTDWIIGNHSDELSPWIPVIAARSSPNCRYFLLPCCAYEFDGSKYQRQNSTNSIYNDYLGYVKHISEVCQFITKVDKLRIPSTKRVCLIGTKKSDTECNSHFENTCAEIQNFISKECKKSDSLKKKVSIQTLTSSNWSDEFRPRESIEKVRNCSQLDKMLINNIIDIVVDQLLQKKRFVLHKPNFLPNWNVGGTIPINDLAKLIPAEMLKELKHNCGGLQTLLKNHQIFEIVGGNVQFRLPKTVTEMEQHLTKKNMKSKLGNSTILLKTKLCWFNTNHPDGCPLNDMECSSKHDISLSSL